MTRKTFRSIVLLVAIVAAVAVTSAPATALQGCHVFYNSSSTYIDGFGYVCAGTGDTCTECWDTGGDDGGSMQCSGDSSNFFCRYLN